MPAAGPIAVHEGHERAFLGEQPARCLADTASPARNEGDAPSHA